MNRRKFIGGVAMAMVGAAVPLKALARKQSHPSSIMLSWRHPEHPLRSHGVATWNISDSMEYEKAEFEVNMQWALLASRGYDVKHHEFKTLRFI